MESLSMTKKRTSYTFSTTVSVDRTIQEFGRVMTEMGVTEWNFIVAQGRDKQGAAAWFKRKGIFVQFTSDRQKNAKTNARAIYHIVHGNWLNELKGVESFERAFGGYINLQLSDVDAIPDDIRAQLILQPQAPLALPKPQENNGEYDDPTTRGS